MVGPKQIILPGLLLLLVITPAIGKVGLPRAVQVELRVVARELAVSRRAQLLANRNAVAAQEAVLAATTDEGGRDLPDLRRRAERAREVFYFWQSRCVSLEQRRGDLRERRRAWRRSDGAIAPRQMPAAGAVEVPFRSDRSRSGWDGGIGIRVEAGDWVRAAAPGTVVFAGTLPAYGGVVVLDHGLRVFTVYGGLGGAEVALDAPVSVGARLGQADLEGGGLVYFSVRRGREALDPQSWHRELESGKSLESSQE
ncbi:MAG: M23 family metallopeptidase [Candidatus Binatia bacterium]|nr:M23 family metallopeptidase [Candidatus Binatia bacterium]MDG2009089.1 M23 family metallopeptidase [Candidatus Binatia bacterium]